MWSYFWKLLFGGPQENATSTSTTTTSTASQSSAESKTIKLERDDQGSGVREIPSSSIENTQTASISETSSEEKSEVKENSSVPTEGATSVDIETKSTAKVEHKDNDTFQAVEEQPDWQAHFQEIELARKDGYLDKAEELLKDGLWDEARQRLESLSKDDRTAEDWYNLGLSYEAGAVSRDDYQQARRAYLEALKKENGNRDFAASVGRVERRLAEYRQLASQRAI